MARGESRLKKEQRIKAGEVPEEEILNVYTYWAQVMRPNRKRLPVLDEKRRLKVAAAIADYGVSECRRAIDGCARSDFHMGRNKQKKRHDDLELIFRDQNHVERFLAFAEEGTDW
jgi:hypothetical protein